MSSRRMRFQHTGCGCKRTIGTRLVTSVGNVQMDVQMQRCEIVNRLFRPVSESCRQFQFCFRLARVVTTYGGDEDEVGRTARDGAGDSLCVCIARTWSDCI